MPTVVEIPRGISTDRKFRKRNYTHGGTVGGSAPDRPDPLTEACLRSEVVGERAPKGTSLPPPTSSLRLRLLQGVGPLGGRAPSGVSEPSGFADTPLTAWEAACIRPPTIKRRKGGRAGNQPSLSPGRALRPSWGKIPPYSDGWQGDGVPPMVEFHSTRG